MLWTLLILVCFSVAFYNIDDLTKDYYNYDVISNVERVTPENYTFPAVTICANSFYTRSYYTNNSLVREENKIYNSNLSMKSFILQKFPGFTTEQIQLEFFQLPGLDFRPIQCFRFNGATNEQMELVKIKGTESWKGFSVVIKDYYRQNISESEFFIYSFGFPFYDVYITDNSLNTYSYIEPVFTLAKSKIHYVKTVKTEIEEKLGKPYNQCKESTNDETYNQMNCIDSCIFKQVAIKYNCTLFTLFQTKELEECTISNKAFGEVNYIYRNEFSKGCENECPRSCETMKFSRELVSFDGLTNLDSNSTKIVVSVIDFSSLKITQIPKTNGWSFVSNLGGSLGLFMGISFLNFIELFAYIIDILFIIF